MFKELGQQKEVLDENAAEVRIMKRERDEVMN